MNIDSIAFQAGNRRVSNEEITDRIIILSRGHLSEDQLQLLSGKIMERFERSGLRERRHVDSSQNQGDMAIDVCHQAMERAGVTAKDIDMLIHCGVGRGFTEPGQSHFLAADLGIRSIHCFDVMDACNSWIQALYLSHHLLQGAHERILVVNTEVPSNTPLADRSFTYSDLSQLTHRFPAATMGDAVSATILSRSEKQWNFEFIHRKDAAPLCAIPNETAPLFTAQRGPEVEDTGAFASYGRKLYQLANDIVPEVLGNLADDRRDFRWIFPHSHTALGWYHWGQQLGDVTPDQLKWNVYPDMGNLTSASMPVAMARAIQAGELQRGDSIALWMAAAGVTCSAVGTVF